MPTKEKEFAYITGFSSNVYKTISAAEARISTTSTPRSYISAMLLALKSLLFFCLDIWNLKLVEFQTAKGKQHL